MELASLRQCLWRRRGEAIGDAADLDERPTDEERTDHVRWVDTDVMPVDPLTKIMEPEKLLEVLEKNRWDSDQPLASLQKKRVKQAQRKAARRPRPAHARLDVDPPDTPPLFPPIPPIPRVSGPSSR